MGVDGFPYGFVSYILAKRSDYPAFNRIFREGRYFKVEVRDETNSPRIWSTIFTGVEPAVHGITGTFRYDRKRGELVLFNAGDLKTPTFWRIASEHGKSVGLSQFDVTYPVNALIPHLSDGDFVISDRARYSNEVMQVLSKSIKGLPTPPAPMVFRPSGPAVYPPALARRLSAPCSKVSLGLFLSGIHPALVDYFEKAFRYFGGVSGEYLACRLAQITDFEDEFVKRKTYPELSGIFYDQLDGLSHVLLQWGSNRTIHDAFFHHREIELFDASDLLMRTLDARLSTILEGLGSEDVLFFVSDHGVHGFHGEEEQRNPLKEGMVTMYSKAGIRVPQNLELTYRDVAPLVLDALGVPRPPYMKRSFLSR